MTVGGITVAVQFVADVITQVVVAQHGCACLMRCSKSILIVVKLGVALVGGTITFGMGMCAALRTVSERIQVW